MVDAFVLAVGLVLLAAGLYLLFVAGRRAGTGLGVWRSTPRSLADAIDAGDQSAIRGTTAVAREAGGGEGGETEAAGETLVAPFSGRDALVVAYAVRELRYQAQGTGRPNFQKSWQTIEEGVAGVPFELNDGTASARVDPADAEPVLAVDQRTRVKGGRKPPEWIARFIDESETVGSEERHYRLGPLKLSAGNDRRYVERRLEPGDEASVFGRATAADGRTDGAIAAGDPFVISDAARGRAVRRLLRGALLPLLFGVALVIAGMLAVVAGL